MRKRVLAVASLIASITLSMTGCVAVRAQSDDAVMPLGQKSFEQYASETYEWMAAHRHFVSNNHKQELALHVPFEIKPEKPNGKGVLLIHGFTDSPFNFRDTAKELAEAGFLVRAIVLPGHGTKPADMLAIDYDNWTQVVHEQTELLAKETENTYLAGFSTGGNLAVTEAYRNTEVDGLILFSPALAIRTKLVNLVPLANLFIDWLKEPDEKTADVTLLRYRNAPLPALKAFSDSMNESFELLKNKPYDKPVLVFMTEHDSIVDTQKLLPIFQKQFRSRDTRLVWYGDKLPEDVQPIDARLTTRSDYLPEQHIRSFSHLGIVFSPQNPWYGPNGKIKYCLRSQNEALRLQCENNEEVWYGSWYENRDGHPYARLSFNPYFQWQTQLIINVLDRL